MFCPSCGAQLAEQSKFCNACGKNLSLVNASSTSFASSSQFQEKAKAVSKDAFNAFKVFFVNPVGGLGTTYEQLGETKAQNVGIIFSVVFTLLSLFGILLLLPSFLRPDFGDILKMIFSLLILPVSMFVVLIGIRTVLQRKANYKADIFITGASILPLGFLILLAGIFNLGNLEVIVALALYAISFTILILYAGCTKILKISETASTISTPIIILLSVWLTKVILFALVFNEL